MPPLPTRVPIPPEVKTEYVTPGPGGKARRNIPYKHLVSPGKSTVANDGYSTSRIDKLCDFSYISFGWIKNRGIKFIGKEGKSASQFVAALHFDAISVSIVGNNGHRG
mmetsp:Transcript_16384/g.47114  ORF Transcript_16384/g.47114 Transcript_16384/m.47114 type:complete len:108 (-) Transcript_16384:395-718(-)